jgi:hypothetical protein
MYVNGSMTLANNLTFNAGVQFISNSTGNILNTNNIYIGGLVYFLGSGDWTLASNFNCNEFNFRNGTLNTNGHNITSNYFYSTNSTTNRTLNLSSSTITVNRWVMPSNDNSLNISKGSSTINCYEFSGGGKSYSTVILKNQGIGFIGGSNTYDNLIIQNTNFVNFEAGQKQTALNFTIQPVSACNARIAFGGMDGLATLEVPSGTINLNDMIIMNLVATGGASFNASNSYGVGNTTGWNIGSGPVNRDFYWIGNAGSWNDGSHWSLSSGGPAVNCTPGPTDNVYFDANSITLANQTIGVGSNAFCKNLNFVNVQNNPTFDGNSYYLFISGSLTLGNPMNNNFGGFYSFIGSSNGNVIDMAGIAMVATVIINGKGEWTLASNLELNFQALMLQQGTLRANGNSINLIGGSFFSIGDSAKTLDISNSHVSCNIWEIDKHMNLNDENGTIELEYYGQFTGNGLHYNRVNIIEASIHGKSTIDTLSLSPSGACYLDDDDTLTINHIHFSSPLGLGSETLIQAVSTSSINYTGGRFCGDYLSISNIKSVGDPFFAGANSIDNGNNTNIYFMDCPDPLELELDSMNVLCNGDSTGWAKIVLAGGLPPYQYLWSNGVTIDSIGKLKAATYTVYAWDALGDTLHRSVTIVQPSPISISFSAPVDVTCNSASAITLSGTPSNGTFSGTGVSGTSFDPTLIANAGYAYITYTIVGANSCSVSITDSIEVTICAGLTNSVTSQIRVYPNPVINTFHISTSSEKTESFEIINSLGEIVYQGNFVVETSLELGFIPQGIYSIKIGEDPGISIFKIVKQ